MNPIGGYFELELCKGDEYHKGAIRLNTGRNAFEYILSAKGYKKVYLPYFTCDAMLESIKKLKLEYEFYHINEQLEPLFNFERIGADETFIYTNYFGIKSEVVKKLSINCHNLIIDNSQAFFEKPIAGIDTFYSPRKFFGVPDGSYLYTDKLLKTKLFRDKSVSRFSHLIKRIDEGAESGYADFKAYEDSLKWQPIKLMSALTQTLLCNIDYDKVSAKRKNNFLLFNRHFEESNRLKFSVDNNFVPMVYPYLITNGKNLKQKLIQKKIFIATYWPNVYKWTHPNDLEYSYTEQIVHLPIDQRISNVELNFIINIISEI